MSFRHIDGTDGNLGDWNSQQAKLIADFFNKEQLELTMQEIQAWKEVFAHSVRVICDDLGETLEDFDYYMTSFQNKLHPHLFNYIYYAGESSKQLSVPSALQKIAVRQDPRQTAALGTQVVLQALIPPVKKEYKGVSVSEAFPIFSRFK